MARQKKPVHRVQMTEGKMCIRDRFTLGSAVNCCFVS